MKRMLINATQPEEIRVALVDGQKLYDLDIEARGSEQKLANIYKGKITRVEPSLEAAFVDYGMERHGFLPLKEVSPEYFNKGTSEGRGRTKIQEVLREGTEVTVQVEKEERGNKGAALTTFISLAGRYMVLMPNNPRGGGISRRIEGDDRSELREAMKDLALPGGMSVIVRTVGIGRNAEELQWDLDFLLNIWNSVTSEAEKLKAPEFLFSENNVIIRTIRDYLRPSIGEVIIDHHPSFLLARDYIHKVMPDYKSKIKFYEDELPLFNRYQIENRIETAFEREVKLPSGGSIVIDMTEALVSVDINSSRATRGSDIEETAFQTNLEAADEIGRQLRIRDLGGLVVIDFIDMTPARNRKAVEERMLKALSIDRARVRMNRISKFGLMEMSRQRLRPSLEETIFESCPRCSGQGAIRGIRSLALSILRLVEEEAQKESTREVQAFVPFDVAAFLLNEKRTAIYELEKRQDPVRILVIPRAELDSPHYSIKRVRLQDGEEPVSSYKVENPYADQVSPAEEALSRPLEAPKKAAVRTVAPSQPAPEGRKKPARNKKTPSKKTEKPGPLGKLSSALKSLFTGVVEPVKEETRQGRNRRNNQNRNNRNRRRPDQSNRNPSRNTVNEEALGNTENRRGNSESHSRNPDNRRRRRPRQDDRGRDEGNAETVENTGTRTQQTSRPETRRRPAKSDLRPRRQRNRGKALEVGNEQPPQTEEATVATIQPEVAPEIVVAEPDIPRLETAKSERREVSPAGDSPGQADAEKASADDIPVPTGETVLEKITGEGATQEVAIQTDETIDKEPVADQPATPGVYTRPSNDPRLTSKPVTAEVDTTLVETRFSGALDTSKPSPVFPQERSIARPGNDPRGSVQVQKSA